MDHVGHNMDLCYEGIRGFASLDLINDLLQLGAKGLYSMHNTGISEKTFHSAQRSMGTCHHQYRKKNTDLNALVRGNDIGPGSKGAKRALCSVVQLMAHAFPKGMLGWQQSQTFISVDGQFTRCTCLSTTRPLRFNTISILQVAG